MSLTRRFFPSAERHLDQQGSFAVVMAICLVFIVTLSSFILDLGSLTREKNRHQAAAEALAMGIADSLYRISGEEELEDLARETLATFNIDLPVDTVEIELGFYDAYDQYDEALGQYQDFSSLADGPLPQGMSANAVLVSIGEEESIASFTGLNGGRKIPGAAVAYVPPFGMVSGGDIDFKGASTISLCNGSIYAHDTVHLRGDQLDRPQDNIRITAGKRLQAYTARTDWWGNVRWQASGTKPKETLPEEALAENHAVSVEDLARRLKQRADKIFTLKDKNQKEFYLALDSKRAAFDFTGDHEGRRIVYIALPEDWTVFLTPYPCPVVDPGLTDCVSCAGTHTNSCSDRQAAGSEMAAMTIVADCKIIIPQFTGVGRAPIALGGEGYKRLHIISLGQIEYRSRYNDMNGITFICRDDFNFQPNSTDAYTPPAMNFISILSETDICFFSNESNNAEQFSFDLSVDLHSPPWVPPALGRLDSGSE